MAAKKKPAKKAVKKKKAKRKAIKKTKAAAPPAVSVPDEMEYFWDKETEDAWNNICFNHRRFFVEWIRQGFNGTKAYAITYPGAGVNTCRNKACYILAKPDVMRIRAQIIATPNWELELAHDIHIDAMKNGSTSEKMSGAKNHVESYERMKGRQPAPSDDKPQNITLVQNNINVIVTKSMENVKHLLNNKWEDE